MTNSLKPVQNTTATPATETPDITLDKLNIDEHIGSVPASPGDVENVRCWDEMLKAQKEGTRTHVTMLLLKMFSCLLVGNFLLTAAAAFVPTADRAFIEKASSQATTPLVGLLGVALGYYFRTTEEE